MSKQLTDLQQAFVYEYAQCLKGIEAARRAGYQGTYDSLRSMASQNLAKPHIRAAIDELLAERALKANEVLGRLSDQAVGLPADCFIISGGRLSVDFEKVREHGLLHLIKKLKYTTRKDGENEIVETTEIELYDAQSALVQLGRSHGVFTDKTDITSDGKPVNNITLVEVVKDRGE